MEVRLMYIDSISRYNGLLFIWIPDTNTIRNEGFSQEC